MVKLGQPRGVKDRVASMAGIDPEVAALFVRKARAKKPAVAPTSDLRPELDAALGRVAELEEEKRLLELRVSVLGEQIDAAAPVFDVTTKAGVDTEGEIAIGRARAARWKACAKLLRERVTSAHRMLNRLRNRTSDPRVRLIGGVAHMKQRAATLAPVDEQPLALVRSELDDSGGEG